MTEIEPSIKIETPVSNVSKYAIDHLKWPVFFEGFCNFKTIRETTRGDGIKFTYKAKMLGMTVTVGTKLQLSGLR